MLDRRNESERAPGPWPPPEPLSAPRANCSAGGAPSAQDIGLSRWQAPVQPASLPDWVGITYWAALAIAAAQFAYALLEPDSYLGECSFETGYVPEAGLMDVLPLGTLAVGLLGMTAAALVRRWREFVLLYAIAAAVMALGVAGWVAVEVMVNTRLCD